VVSSMFFFQAVFDDKHTRRWSFISLAPIAWILFYMMTYIESYALRTSIKTALKGEEVTWQRWERKGVNS